MEFLVAEADGERACWFYGKDAWISMPPTSIEVQVLEDLSGYRIDLHARDLVRDLHLDVGRIDPDATVDRNLLTLFPGEMTSLRLEGVKRCPLETVQACFRGGGVFLAANDCITTGR